VLFFSTISACSSTISTQASVDTRTCNALSYGNDNLSVLSMDDVYNTCMNNKKLEREKQKRTKERLAFFEFLLNALLPSKKEG
jgi:hypothetical protein